MRGAIAHRNGLILGRHAPLTSLPESAQAPADESQIRLPPTLDDRHPKNILA